MAVAISASVACNAASGLLTTEVSFRDAVRLQAVAVRPVPRRSSQVTEAMVSGGVRTGNRSLRLRATTGEQITVRSVPVQVVWELLEAGHRYLDVRTPEEFLESHVEGAVNVPYMFRHQGGMTKNTTFLEEVSEHFDKGDEIVVGCQSGKRSLMAVKDLQSADYICITDMGGGFNVWLESGLPVTRRT